jgi:hypothetical protein
MATTQNNAIGIHKQKNHKEDWAHVLRLVEEDINLIKKNEIYE